MTIGRPLVQLDETGSTMDLAARLADDGAATGTTVLAGHQTAGRGRSGRTWSTAPQTSILMSFVTHTVRRHHELGAFSLLLGLAVAQTVDRFVPSVSAIKWPNDVLIEGRKVAGILVTSRTLPDRDDLCLIAGIGLNVNNKASQLPATGTSIGVLCGTAQRFDDVWSSLLENLTFIVDCFEEGDTDELWQAVEQRLAFRNEVVRIDDGPRSHEGVVTGLTRGGLLELRLASGAVVAVAAGDLTRGPVVTGLKSGERS